MSTEKKTNTPLLISIICFALGMIIGAWGLIKEDCNNSPDCYVGSGFLLWAGGLMIVAGLIGIFTIGNRKSVK